MWSVRHSAELDVEKRFSPLCFAPVEMTRFRVERGSVRILQNPHLRIEMWGTRS
jgi:hypothetical protein